MSKVKVGIGLPVSFSTSLTRAIAFWRLNFGKPGRAIVGGSRYERARRDRRDAVPDVLHDHLGVGRVGERLADLYVVEGGRGRD